ncbi:hypothetical protein Q9R08_04475 [Microbacterium sp. QXD-8]|uniref:Uncharacterized protein n=1 Tax=Microbacterium psychrotolerans TaxID=3068321 RepID=A0ABU0YY15_9MICO|nr:hypothetical protein [Microbacterium sp. QXD-8]MDQ7877227.1 hypothetical protein [Microbacterium sp. QXD-8]
MLEVGRDDAAGLAGAQVRVEASPVTAGDRLALAGHEKLAHPAALRRTRGVADVGLQPGLLEALAGTVCERRHRVGAHAEQRCHLAGLHALDLDVPEQRPPAGRQLAERLREHGAVGDEFGELGGGVRGPLVQVVERNLAGAPTPGGGGVADGGEEVRTEAVLRAAALADRGEDRRERLRNQVVGIDVRAHGSRRTACARDVPLPEHRVRGLVAPAREDDEVLVGPLAQRTVDDGAVGAGHDLSSPGGRFRFQPATADRRQASDARWETAGQCPGAHAERVCTGQDACGRES